VDLVDLLDIKVHAGGIGSKDEAIEREEEQSLEHCMMFDRAGRLRD
jgi:hypothetical protein